MQPSHTTNNEVTSKPNRLEAAGVTDFMTGKMLDRERREYESYKARCLETAFPNFKLVAYTIKNGRPSNIEVITFGQLAIGLKDEPTFRVMHNGGGQIISMTPQRVGEMNVFLSLAPKFEFRWVGREMNGDWEFRAEYGVLIKTACYDRFAREGDTCCISFRRFLELFPEFKDEVTRISHAGNAARTLAKSCSA